MFKFNKKSIMKTLLVLLTFGAVGAVFASSLPASATPATDFQTVLNTITGWTEGTLGQSIAVTMVLVGLIGGIARQSLFAAVVGIGGGMALAYAPSIIGTVFTAGLPVTL